MNEQLLAGRDAGDRQYQLCHCSRASRGRTLEETGPREARPLADDRGAGEGQRQNLNMAGPRVCPTGEPRQRLMHSRLSLFVTAKPNLRRPLSSATPLEPWSCSESPGSRAEPPAPQAPGMPTAPNPPGCSRLSEKPFSALATAPLTRQQTLNINHIAQHMSEPERGAERQPPPRLPGRTAFSSDPRPLSWESACPQTRWSN